MEPPFGLGVKWREPTDIEADYYEIMTAGLISLEPFYGEITDLFSQDVVDNFTERYWSVKEDWIKANIYYEDSIESYFNYVEDDDFYWYSDDNFFTEYYNFYGYDWDYLYTTYDLNFCEHVE